VGYLFHGDPLLRQMELKSCW